MEIAGKRITLRNPRITDLEMYHKWRSDPEIMKFSLLKRSRSMEESYVYLGEDIQNHFLENNAQFVLKSVTDKKSGNYMGSAGFEILKSCESGGIAEIGYFILEEYWGQGFASECALLLLDYIFKNYNIHKIIANCDSRNGASEKVMIKSGMQKEALLKLDRCIEGKWSDTLRYSIFRSDFRT
jgi:ribosomal-protein-alanine N-acetyltransferase